MLIRRKASRIAAGLAVPVIATLVAGCHSDTSANSSGMTTASGSASTGPAATTPAPTTPASSSPASSSPASSTTGSSTIGTSPAGSTSPAAPSGPVNCTEDQLRASIDPRHIPGNDTPGATGRIQHAVLADFKNVSGSSCLITGYPGGAVVADSGAQVQQARRTLRGPLGGLPTGQPGPAQVTLRPGSYVAAMFEGVDQKQIGAAQAGCDAAKYPRILITPPNTTIPVPFTVGWPKCYSFDVHPVEPVMPPAS